jgi:hypothetical protein
MLIDNFLFYSFFLYSLRQVNVYLVVSVWIMLRFFYVLECVRYVPKSSLKIEAKFIVDHINEIKI